MAGEILHETVPADGMSAVREEGYMKKKCKHIKQPEGYFPRQHWMEKMFENGYEQRRCETCMLWKIWAKDGVEVFKVKLS